jgi:hypothetical protein
MLEVFSNFDDICMILLSHLCCENGLTGRKKKGENSRCRIEGFRSSRRPKIPKIPVFRLLNQKINKNVFLSLSLLSVTLDSTKSVLNERAKSNFLGFF